MDEVKNYLRKISVLEDWFQYLCGRGELKRPWEFRKRLLELRPAHLPTITSLDSLTKIQLLALTYPLADYAWELDEIRLEFVAKGIPKSSFRRFWITMYMYDFERGRWPRWQGPFTFGERLKYRLFDRKDEELSPEEEKQYLSELSTPPPSSEP